MDAPGAPEPAGAGRSRPTGASRRTAARWIGVALLLTVGLAGCAAPEAEGDTAAARAASGEAPSPTPDRVSSGEKSLAPVRSVRSYPRVAVPVRLRIPAVGIDTTVERVGLASDGTVAPPSGWQTAGWYRKGPRPGQDGPAVIVGHVDSRQGPAVFFRLPELRPGDSVYVDRADGSSVRFRVTTQWQVPKTNFPADLVYAPTLEASLRLVTCGGDFDTSIGHYQDNIIVSAVPG